MTGHPSGRTVALSTLTPQPDGGVVLRRWSMCEHCAAALTEPLGEPDTEVLMPADAVGRIIARGPDPESVVIAREPS